MRGGWLRRGTGGAHGRKSWGRRRDLSVVVGTKKEVVNWDDRRTFGFVRCCCEVAEGGRILRTRRSVV